MSFQHPTLEALAASISNIFDWPFGQLLKSFCEHTGQRWGIVPDDLFWFRPPGMHIFEALFFAPFLYTLWVWYGIPCTNKLLYGNDSAFSSRIGGRFPSSFSPLNFGKRNSNQNNKFSSPPLLSVASPTPSGGSNSKPMFGTDFVCGLIMIICYAAQVFFKITRTNPLVQLCWMAVPCHLITFVWAYILLSPPSWNNYRTCRFLAALLAMSSWGGIAASAFPDWSDHQYWIEGPMFYIHHGVLVILPHYWAAKHGMHRLTWELFWTYIVVALGINFFVYTPLSYISGVNVNYNLHPHLKMAVRTQWYRFIVPSVLAVWAVVYWYFTYLMNKVFYRICYSSNVVGESSYEILTPVVQSPNRPSARSPAPTPSPNTNRSRITSPNQNVSPTIPPTTKKKGTATTSTRSASSSAKKKKRA